VLGYWKSLQLVTSFDTRVFVIDKKFDID